MSGAAADRPVSVIKVGGNEVEDPNWLTRLADAVSSSGGRVVIVHGGGKEVTEVQRTLGAEPEWHDGLRITTPEALRAVAMVLSGVVNKRLVAALLTAGRDAVGLSGEDGGLLGAIPARGGQLGRTGEISSVRTELVFRLLELGLTPVISPVSRGPEGGALNVNADDAASAVASALGAAEFRLVSNVPGVLRDGQRLPSVTTADLEELIRAGVASGGMVPKLRAAMRAACSGVGDVRIGDLSLLEDADAGTRIIP